LFNGKSKWKLFLSKGTRKKKAMISIVSGGSFANIERFLNTMKTGDSLSFLDEYGRQGVDALSSETPVDSGLAAASWSYDTSSKGGVYTITWYNDDVENGFPVAIMLQYGYTTGTGGYVAGRDYINPAIQPVFDKIANEVWERVKNA
jgi:hypothetical protein